VYFAPKTLEEALKALAKQPERAKIIAGGTDLIPRLRSGIINPTLLVDLLNIPLHNIEIREGWIHIGARVTHTDILESNLLASYCPVIVDATKEIAGPPIRNRGTIGGNLVNASPAADLALPLLAYDAIVVLAKEGGERKVLLSEFFTGPGQTILTPNEILTEIRIPAIPPHTASSFIKLGKRKAMAIAVVSVVTRLTLDDIGNIYQARIALGSVAPRPMRSIMAEAVLEGMMPSMEIFANSAQVASMESSPISDIRASGDYRKKMVAVLTKRSLVTTWHRLEKKD